MGFKTGFSKSTWGKGLCFLQRVKQMGKAVKSILHLLLLGNPYSYSSPSQCCAAAGCWGPRGGQGCLRYRPPCGAPGSAKPRVGQAPPSLPRTGRGRGFTTPSWGRGWSVSQDLSPDFSKLVGLREMTPMLWEWKRRKFLKRHYSKKSLS